MVSTRLITELRDRGYRLYADRDSSGNRLQEPFEGGLVVTPDEFLQARDAGENTGDFYFHEVSRATRFCLGPVCETPLSPVEVRKQISILENAGTVPYGLMANTWFSIVDLGSLRIVLPSSLPNIN